MAQVAHSPAPTAAAPAACLLGRSVTRKEDRRLVTGHGLYVDDVVLPGMLHSAFVRSDVARGTIARVDVSAAREAPDVVAVFTAAEFEGRYGDAFNAVLGEVRGAVPPPLAVSDVRYVGEPVALVVAKSRAAAEDAGDLVEIDYDEANPVVDYRTAADNVVDIVHAVDGAESNAAPASPNASPDLDERFASASHVVEYTIEHNRYLCVPMETRGIVAAWEPGRDEMEIACATQSVHEMRNFFARFLGVADASVHVSARDVGGGFGLKAFVSREECAIVLASRLLARPVKWVEDRRENLIASPHARNEIGHVRLAIGDDEQILAVTVDHRGDVGAFPACPAVINASLLPGPYKIGGLGYATTTVNTNTMGKGAYRGPWLFETTAREMCIDLAARDLGVDPIELRRKNLLSVADLPFTSPAGHVFDEVTPLETLEQALSILDLAAFRTEQAAAREQGRLLGVGVSVYIEPSAMAAIALYTEAATVRVEVSGKVTAYVGTTSHGQSIETTMAQVVAEHLGVDYDDVTLVQADTASTPFGPGTGGSRTAVIAGGAAREATVALRAKLVAIAAEMLEAAPEDIDVEHGVLSVRGTPTRSLPIAAVADRVYNATHLLPDTVPGDLEATVRFKPTRFPTWSNATHICVVEIDPLTYIPHVLRYIVSEDCGPMINPAVVEGQIAGGVVQGIGGVLLENFVYDEHGNPLTTTFMDYLVPTAAEIPTIEMGHIETASSTNPSGYKGMGEGGAIGSPAAVANAVGDALAHLGVRVTKTPLGPNDIFELVSAAGATGAGA